MDPYKHIRAIWPYLAAAAGLATLLLDLLVSPTPPHPLLLARPDLLGVLLPGLLTFAGACAAGSKAGKRGNLLILFAPALLLLAPMVAGIQWCLPLEYVASWGATGSPDGFVTAFLALAVVLVATTSAVTAGCGLPHAIANRLLALLALAMPWLAVLYQVIWNSSAQLGRVAASAGLHSAAFCLLYAGRYRFGPLQSCVDSLRTETRKWLYALADVVPIALVLTVYFVLKLETVAWSTTDEGIYFYAAAAFARGEMPYRDFFFSHPPLHVLVPGVVCMLFGFSFTALKLLSVGFSLGSGLCLYLSLRLFGTRLAALVGTAVFLFSLEQLQGSTNLTGINMTVFFLCASACCALAGRQVASGLLGAASILTGIYAVGPALAILAVSFHRSWKAGARALGALGAALVLVNGLFLALYGSVYTDQVVTYHFSKPAKVEGFLSPGTGDFAALLAAGLGLLCLVRLAGYLARNGLSRRSLRHVPALAALGGLLLATLTALVISVPSGDAGVRAGLSLFAHNSLSFLNDKEFLRFAFFHAHLALAPLSFLFSFAVHRVARGFGLGQPFRMDGAWAGLAMFAAAFVLLSSLRETYTFYYLLLIPGAALMLGPAWRLVISPLTGKWSAAHRWWSGASAVVATLAMMAACTAWVPFTMHVGNRRFPEESQAPGLLHCYRLPDNTPSPFSGFIRSSLPRCRWRGSTEASVYHYLWKKTRYFSTARAIADFVAASSTADETVVGSSLVAPLVALLADRRVAAGFVDTNSKRFKSGMTREPDAWRKVCHQRPDWTEQRCKAAAAEKEMWDAVCRTPLRFVIAAPRSFFTPQRMRNHPVLRKHFKPVTWFNDSFVNANGRYPVVLYRRTRDAPSAAGTWCGY